MSLNPKSQLLIKQNERSFINALFYRFVQSLVLGAYYYLQDPKNEYVLVTAQSGGWKALMDFWSTPREDLFKLWSQIDQSYNLDT